MNLTLTATITETINIDEGLVLEYWCEYLEDNPNYGVPENIDPWLEDYLSNNIDFSRRAGYCDQYGDGLDIPWEFDEKTFKATKKALKDYILKEWWKN